MGMLQAQSQSALSQQDVSVSSLKACWDALYPEKGNSGYITLVTSSFPSTKVLHDYTSFFVIGLNKFSKIF